jgi:hypothetical protein
MIEMKHINEHKLSKNVSTHIREGFDGWQAGFTVQQQTFYLQPVSAEKGDEEDTRAKAKWYQKNLDLALNKILNNKYEKLLP